ncbi:MAG: L-asparaginase [Methanobacteriota archaeon]|nr:MAG: L-asparaginase [Euryarchaeota archaeon]
MTRRSVASPVVVTHCGAGSTLEIVDAAETAGRAALSALDGGGRALDAVTNAIVVLEDDERTNAGTGSRLRIDGRAQMDASIMTEDLESGAVAAIEGVRNPILVARKVMETPHVLLVGADAVAFARRMGFQSHNPVTAAAKVRWKESLDRIRRGDLPPHARKWRDFRDLAGTVGAVARDSRGHFCAGSSTGGTAFMMPGRVGDTPIVGAGIYCGSAGAVSVTGHGEEIIRRVLSKSVYDLMARGRRTQAACDEGLRLFKKTIPIGIIAVGKDGAGEACNRKMAWWTNAP